MGAIKIRSIIVITRERKNADTRAYRFFKSSLLHSPVELAATMFRSDKQITA